MSRKCRYYHQKSGLCTSFDAFERNNLQNFVTLEDCDISKTVLLIIVSDCIVDDYMACLAICFFP